MKKIMLYLLLIVCFTSLVGCSKSSTEIEKNGLKVLSVYGEDSVFSVSNGVLVIDGENDIFYGGDISLNDKEELKDVTSFSTEFYASSKLGKDVLMSNIIEDKTGDSVDFPHDLGKISGDIVTNPDIDHIGVKIKTKSSNGEKNKYHLELKFVDVTKNVSR